MTLYFLANTRDDLPEKKFSIRGGLSMFIDHLSDFLRLTDRKHSSLCNCAELYRRSHPAEEPRIRKSEKDTASLKTITTTNFKATTSWFLIM